MKVNVDGKEVEVLTAEEAQAKADEAATKALDDYKAEHPDQSAAFTKLQDDLKKANDALDAGKGGNSGQVERLRRERDDAEKALTEGITKLTGEIEGFKKERTEEVQGALLDQYAGSNKELREKILIEFNNYKPNATSRGDIAERMAKAFQLAGGTRPAPNFSNGITNSGSRGDGYVPPAERQETANGVAMRKVFGISDEQAKRAQEVLKKNK